MEDGNTNMPGINMPRPDWGLAQKLECEECGHDVFVQGIYLFKLSKIAAFSDKDMIKPKPTFACAKCGHVNKDFVVTSGV